MPAYNDPQKPCLDIDLNKFDLDLDCKQYVGRKPFDLTLIN